MARYLLKRVLLALPVLLGVSIVVFTMIRLIPGDPAQLMAGQAATQEIITGIRRDLGLDRPIVVQYAYFLRNAVRGNLGYSLFNRAPVTEELALRFPRTLRLGLASMLVAGAIGVPAGIISATRHLSWIDSLVMVAASAAIIARMTRSAMLEVLRQDYVRTARAKGVAEPSVIGRHALRNALIPVVTVVGLQLGTLLGGAVLTESVFAC